MRISRCDIDVILKIKSCNNNNNNSSSNNNSSFMLEKKANEKSTQEFRKKIK